MNTLHRKIKLNKYFKNGAAIIMCFFIIWLWPLPQQTVFELTEIHKNLSECVWRASFLSCEILSLSIPWFRKFTEKISKMRRWLATWPVHVILKSYINHPLPFKKKGYIAFCVTYTCYYLTDFKLGTLALRTLRGVVVERIGPLYPHVCLGK